MKEEILKGQWNFPFIMPGDCGQGLYNHGRMWKPHEFIILERVRTGGGVQEKLQQHEK